ncbi:CT392 family protein [Candidatus Chlamydia corallus]|uniref:CT392 family protein n=1 Tax=Candidatus Chlamydia corallus TaxID=2038470 RepID=UPI001EFCCCDA|nr:hypothetical protein [Candidatus Chlamydia corallus]
MSSVNQTPGAPTPPEKLPRSKDTEKSAGVSPGDDSQGTSAVALPIVTALSVPEGIGATSAEVVNSTMGEIVAETSSNTIFSEQLTSLVERVQGLLQDLDSVQGLVNEVASELSACFPSRAGASRSKEESPRSTEGASLERLESLRKDYETLLRYVRSFEKRSRLSLSLLTDLHHKLQGTSREDLNLLFADSKVVLDQLEFLGLELNAREEHWNLNFEKGLPSIVLTSTDLLLKVEKMEIPTLEEFQAMKQSEVPGSQDSSTPEGSLSCCERLLNELRRLWATFVGFISSCYDNITFVLMWIARRLGLLPGSRSSPTLNPDASQEQQSAAADRSSSKKVDGSRRSDVSEEDGILRPDADSSSPESLHRDRRNQTRATDRGQQGNLSEGEGGTVL